jgi:hypothetical protein
VLELPSPVILRKMDSYEMIAIKDWFETSATEIVGIFNNALIIKNKRVTSYGSDDEFI